LANNVSNGIEPIFSSNFKRNVRTHNGELKQFTVSDYVLNVWRQAHDHHSLPPAWVDSQSLTPEDHLQIQAAVQPFIDNAISKTINLPENFSFEKLYEVYTKAYQLGLKGCTIYRPNPISGSVLEITEFIDRCCLI
jgi:ribonucleoside-diphosphate reductase alpha chain